MPTISTKTVKAAKRPTQKSRLALQRDQLIFYGVILGCVITLLIHFWVQVGLAVSGGNQRERELRAITALHEMVVMEEEQQFQEELKIVEAAQTEDQAAKRREEEFESRLSLKPDLAQTETEKKLLEMKKLGESTDQPPAEALTKLVKLAVPPESSVKVEGDKALVVEVIISHPEIAKQVEKKVRPTLAAVYYEAKMTAAAIIKDVFSLGAGLGVAKVIVRCQNQEVVRTGTEEKTEIRDLLVVSAIPGNSDWKRMTLAEVQGQWQKEKDEYPALLRIK